MCNSIFNFRYTFQSRRLFSYTVLAEAQGSLRADAGLLLMFGKKTRRRTVICGTMYSNDWLCCAVLWGWKMTSFPETGMCVFIIYILVWIKRLLRSDLILTFHYYWERYMAFPSRNPLKYIIMSNFSLPVWLKPQPFISIHSPRHTTPTTYNRV